MGISASMQTEGSGHEKRLAAMGSWDKVSLPLWGRWPNEVRTDEVISRTHKLEPSIPRKHSACGGLVLRLQPHACAVSQRSAQCVRYATPMGHTSSLNCTLGLCAGMSPRSSR